jgi:hypothetical protein
MARKRLKSKAEPTAVSALPASYHPGAQALRRVVPEARGSMPPAIVRHPRRTVLINVKVSEELAIALAERAKSEGITQKQVITRALAAAGLPVDALDLQDRSPRRRRAA